MTASQQKLKVYCYFISTPDNVKEIVCFDRKRETLGSAEKNTGLVEKLVF